MVGQMYLPHWTVVLVFESVESSLFFSLCITLFRACITSECSFPAFILGCVGKTNKKAAESLSSCKVKYLGLVISSDGTFL